MLARRFDDGTIQLGVHPNLNTVLVSTLVRDRLPRPEVRLHRHDRATRSSATDDIPESVAYRFNNGVPNLIQMRATPYESSTNMRAEMGLFVQDRWTIGQA